MTFLFLIVIFKLNKNIIPFTKNKQGNIMKKLLLSLVLLVSFAFALDVNKASVEDFASIKGIGDKKAKAIVAYRKSLGGKFKSDNDLLKVKGIGKKTLKNIQDDVKNASKSKKSKKKNRKNKKK